MRASFPLTLSLPVAVVGLLTACAKTEQASAPAAAASPPVAQVDGIPISRAEYDVYVKDLLRGRQPGQAEMRPDQLTSEQRNQVLDDLINTRLVANQSSKDGTDKDSDVQAQLGLVQMRVLADAEVQKFLKDHQPTDAELHAEFDRQAAATDLTEYHARHILVAKDKKDLAVQLIKKLKHGAKFEDLAKDNSIDPGSKSRGGDLGWFNTARMVKPFADAVKGLKKGELTPEPVETQYGWHIIELEDTRPPSFDSVNKQQLVNPIMQKKLHDYIEDLKKNAKIERNLAASGSKPEAGASSPPGPPAGAAPSATTPAPQGAAPPASAPPAGPSPPSNP
ncbi:MAG TPA: peptidylprolyl isomerase [Steroidobacteraceae bacterium]|nr:peptidylprolyl isomerase [Steroidobacteraceae bacterium]